MIHWQKLLTSLKIRVYALLYPLVQLRNRHFLLADLVVFVCSPALALYLRTDTLVSLQTYSVPLLYYTGLALALRSLLFYRFGIYRRYWRFASSIDLVQLTTAMLIALLILVGLSEIRRSYTPWPSLPRSIPFLDAMIGFLGVVGFRATIWLAANGQAKVERRQQPQQVIRVLIAGAGYTGALLAREIRHNTNVHMQLMGFLDDDPQKQGMEMHGARVLGNRTQLAHLLQAQAIDRVLIAMPTADGAVLREIVSICRQAGVTPLTLPGLHELINGSVNINHLRTVQIEDLLRRATIHTDTAAVKHLLQGRRVLVTGGGGSIGSELCRQILRCQPAELILLGHGENSIFEISNELRRLQHELSQLTGSRAWPTTITPVIADLRFQERIAAICQTHRPEVIFHAAAHKHVPLMEGNVVEAITNNVMGTKILLNAARQAGVERFVMISTDKAVNPTNVMGASKRAAELLVLQTARSTGRFYQVVRFGNVLGSRGSVLHTFKQQIANGGPVTVTHPEIIRYFMTIPEAVQLVLQASVIGQGGEVLMLDMGDPVRIVDLAQDLITLSGLEVGHDIQIEFSGLRPGEKLFEEMFTPNEAYGPTQHAKILVARNASQFVPDNLNTQLDALIGAALKNESDSVVRLLQQLLPEYRPWEQPVRATNTGPQPPPKAEHNKPFVFNPVPG